MLGARIVQLHRINILRHDVSVRRNLRTAASYHINIQASSLVNDSKLRGSICTTGVIIQHETEVEREL